MRLIMKNILVAIDFSQISQKTIETAVLITEKTDARLTIVHVEEPEPDFVGYDTGPQCVRDYKASDIHKNTKILEQLKKELSAKGIDVHYKQLQGATVQCIIKTAVRTCADLIVIASHQHGFLHHLIFGHVTNSLIEESEVPVMIIPEHIT